LFLRGRNTKIKQALLGVAKYSATMLNGTHKVDENSIYRITSLIKVFIVLVRLLRLKDIDSD
jgi:hypothetical protein